MTGPRVGIDLGTTNTSVAVDGSVVAIGEPRQAVLPSVVAFLPNGATLVGGSAKRRRAIDPKNTIFSAKRIIGRGWFARETREFQQRYPFELIRTQENMPAFKTRAGVFSPSSIAAIVLEAARRHLPASSASARVTVAVPSDFGPPQRLATERAAHEAGWSDARIVDEPIATAWAQLGHGAVAPRPAGLAAVYDLGGGTFDFAVIDCASDPFRVIGHAGDGYLGGDDVDLGLATWAADRLLEEHRWDLRSDPEVFDRLVAECERAKVRLSFAARTRVELAQVDPTGPAACGALSLDRQTMATICHTLVQRTFATCDDLLRQLGLKASQIEAVFPAGGTTQLPMIRAGLAAYFGCPPRCDNDPMEVVAIGASRMP